METIGGDGREKGLVKKKGKQIDDRYGWTSPRTIYKQHECMNVGR